jgi:hypothetical protein
MNKLISELERLYFLDGQQWLSGISDAGGEPAYHAAGVLTPAIVANSLAGEKDVALNLVSADGMARAMVVDFGRASDWGPVETLYQAVQNDLNLPPPAVSVSGSKGYGLWFSLAEAVPVAQAQAFLDALRRNYLADLPDASLVLRPDAGQSAAAAQAVIKLPPSLHPASGKWSAFIDPTLGGMFFDEPWLEMAPNSARQADLLAALESIKAEDFQKALILLQSAFESVNPAGLAGAQRPENAAGQAAGEFVSGTRSPRSRLNVSKAYSDPESFLLAVMNDPSASARLRIAAAKALLPSFRKKKTD